MIAVIAAIMLVASVSISSASAWGTQVGSFTFNGVTVIAKSNGYNDFNSKSWSDYGLQYQCVEYVNRFYVEALGHKNMIHTGDANQYFSSASSKGLDAYPNGGTVPPQPGDILCSNGGDHGHVAIVREVTNNKVYVIHQNWANGPSDNKKEIGMTVSNGKYAVNSFGTNYPVVGWLRKPGSVTPPTPTPSSLIPLAGDMYKNGKDITGTFNPDTNEFTFNGKTVTFGIKGDLPVIGDWNGDGYDEIGVCRPDQDGKSYFYLVTRHWSSLSTNAGSADKTIPFGSYPKDIPIVGDWDGNGKDDVGGFLSENAKFYLYTLDLDGSKVKSYKDFSFGNPGDIPIAGDWDGNGKDEIGIFRYPYPNNSNTNAFYFAFDLNNLNGIEPVGYGDKGDYPLIGDWDGDNDDNIGVYRPATKEFMKDDSIPKTPYNPEPPVSDFSATPLKGNAPLKVTFTDKSTGEPTDWHWDFGDGETSTSKSPVHTYSKAGSYTVTLTVSNEAGESEETKSNYITVTEPVQKSVAAFSASPTSGKVPLKVQFTDTSTGEPTSWKWDFGDGSKSFSQNPTHKYSKAGVYTVSLTVKNAAGRNTVTKTDYIKVITKPVAEFSAKLTSGKVPLKVTFTDTSTGTPAGWKWNFGDGSKSFSQNPTHKYSKAGIYTVSLTVKNAAGTNTKTIKNYITVKVAE